MDIISVKDPVWVDDTHSSIHLTVLFDGFNSEVPFIASPDDIEPHGIELFNRALADEFGTILPPVVIVPEAVVEPELTFTQQFHIKMRSLKSARSKEIAILLGTHEVNLSNVESKISRLSTVAQEIRNEPANFYGLPFNGSILPKTKAETLKVANDYLAARIVESNAIDVIVAKYNDKIATLSTATTIEEINAIV